MRNVWSEKVIGNPMFILVSKLKKVKHKMISLRRDRFSNVSEAVVEAKKVMITAQEAIQTYPLNASVDAMEKRALSNYARLARHEESIIKQQSRIQWMDFGDSNTQFFHSSVKERRCRNNILSLKNDNGVMFDEDKEISLECTSFFSNLFTGAGSPGINNPDAEFIQFSKVVSDSDATSLVAPITRDEIIYALSCIGSNKAPGPDGFTSHFFKVCWSIVEADFVKDIQNFFTSFKLLGEVNNTFLTLVPKIDNPSTIADFRPISCCNVIYKCVTKILAIRMKYVLKDLVSENQSAFISGRSIQDNILLAHEIIRNYHRDKGPTKCAMKIDIRKAYHTVS